GTVVYRFAAVLDEGCCRKGGGAQPFRMAVGKGVVAAALMDHVEMLVMADGAGRGGRIVLDGVQAVAVGAVEEGSARLRRGHWRALVHPARIGISLRPDDQRRGKGNAGCRNAAPPVRRVALKYVGVPDIAGAHAKRLAVPPAIPAARARIGGT